MLKIKNTNILGWEHAIRGIRNLMNSLERSDSGYRHYSDVTHTDMGLFDYPQNENDELEIGPEDLDLMIRLCSVGTDHRRFIGMITVYLDITAPLYWWNEFDTYKVGTVANFCSTMHKVAAKEFTIDDFSHEHLTQGSKLTLSETINQLNELRSWYLRWDAMADEDKRKFDPAISCKKDIWWQMIQLLPSSYNQRRTVILNYEVLFNIYKSRQDHKLDEWCTFCDWIKELPYSELITI